MIKFSTGIQILDLLLIIIASSMLIIFGIFSLYIIYNQIKQVIMAIKSSIKKKWKNDW